MSKLSLVKSEHFGQVEADIYSNGNDVFITIGQLAEYLEYSGRDGIEKILKRNSYLKQPTFSVTDNLSATDGKQYETRIFTEDGIYEVTLLSSQPKAKEFRAWVRGVLKALRRGQDPRVVGSEAEKIAAQRERSKAMLLNAQTRMYNTIMKTIDNKKLSPIAAEVFGLAALEEITGQKINYRPPCEATYTATEIAEECGVTATRVGRLANLNGLKTEQYGITVMDKSPYSAKEVPSFRYNEDGRAKIRELLAGLGF